MTKTQYIKEAVLFPSHKGTPFRGENLEDFGQSFRALKKYIGNIIKCNT